MVIEVSVSAPIAFDAAAMTELAFCAAAPVESVKKSAATVSVLSSMRASSTRGGNLCIACGLYRAGGALAFTGKRPVEVTEGTEGTGLHGETEARRTKDQNSPFLRASVLIRWLRLLRYLFPDHVRQIP